MPYGPKLLCIHIFTCIMCRKCTEICIILSRNGRVNFVDVYKPRVINGVCKFNINCDATLLVTIYRQVSIDLVKRKNVLFYWTQWTQVFKLIYVCFYYVLFIFIEEHTYSIHFLRIQHLYINLDYTIIQYIT